jgi:hypothetical protein
MKWATYKLLAVIGLMLNSAIYLVAVLVLAVYFNRPLVWRFDLIAISVTYLSYAAHVCSEENNDPWHSAATILVYLSIGLAAIAGVALFLGS